jgi:hypothetical protein
MIEQTMIKTLYQALIKTADLGGDLATIQYSYHIHTAGSYN